MKSRTSFFNKTVLLKDITRFSPVWISYAVIMLMTTLSSITTGLFEKGYMAYSLGSSINGMAITNMLYAIICAIFLFGDLFSSRLCNALHAFPLRRESWFATHMLAGFLFSIVPNTATALINLPFLGETWFIAPLWLGAMAIQFLFFFSLAAVCVMLTGSRFAASAVYLIINLLSILGYWFVYTYYEPLLPGLHIRDTGFTLFCPVGFLSSREFVIFQEFEYTNPNWGTTDFIWSYEYIGLSSDWWYMAVLAGLGLGLLGLGLWLYRKRALETAGDFLCFRKTQPVFLVIFTLAIGATFQSIFGLMGGGIFSMLIGLAIGCYAGQMLLRRTVKVFDKRSIIWCGSIVGAMALTLLITIFDPVGLTRWQPEPEQVERIVLSDYYEYTPEYDYMDAITVTDPKEIQDLIEIHGLLIDEKFVLDLDLLFIFDSEIGSVHLTYQLSNGTQVERRYYYDTGSDAGKRLNKYFGSPEFVLGYEDWDAYLANISTIYLDKIGVDTVELTREESHAFMEAVKADCEAGTFLAKWDENWELQATIYDDQDQYINSIPINSSCVNTYSWLQTNFPDLTL